MLYKRMFVRIVYICGLINNKKCEEIFIHFHLNVRHLQYFNCTKDWNT